MRKEIILVCFVMINIVSLSRCLFSGLGRTLGKSTGGFKQYYNPQLLAPGGRALGETQLFMSTSRGNKSMVEKSLAAAQSLMSLDDADAAFEIEGPQEGSLRTKVRQHVNPLASKYQLPAELPSDWLVEAFDEPGRPMVVDIGCAKGTWALQYASTHKEDLNVLGLEIRRPIVELALSRKKRWELGNVHFIASNANVDIERVLSDIQAQPGCSVTMVTIQFPDPYFKKKQHKRRVVNTDLVVTLAKYLDAGTTLFVQSDVLDVQEWMVDVINASPYFDAGEGYDSTRLSENSPAYPIRTEREIATVNKGLPVYRMLYKRNDRTI